MKVKISNINEKTKIIIKRWMQLEIIEESDNSLTIKGYNRLIELVLLEQYHRKKRHPELNYKVEYLKE